jgi:hypothetical protein
MFLSQMLGPMSDCGFIGSDLKGEPSMTKSTTRSTNEINDEINENETL